MLKFQSVLLEVWQQACRHIEIREASRRIAELLQADMPIDRLAVFRVNTSRSTVELLCEGGPLLEAGRSHATIPCSTSSMEQLLDWCRRQEVARRSDTACDTPWKTFLPDENDCDVLAGPLTDSVDRFGLLVLAAPKRTEFTARHRSLAQVLLEPFSAALRNNDRMREMAALRAAAEAENQSLLTRLGRTEIADTVIGADSGLRSVMQRIELVARADVPVLIFGETGVGKELVARAIHQRSPRSAGPVVRVNCGAIPPELIDSQLFGHQRGAFTGAVASRKGWFERADGGTLFLDEIGELPHPAQVRLLRVLQDGWLERVGDTEPIKVDVRIVAATHRDLAGMVSQGTFREDLWYRLAVFPILLPPLRDRVEDIPALASHFAQRAGTRLGLPVVEPTPDDLKLLAAYSWPGNIRELAAVIDRAAILGNGTSLDIATALGSDNHSAARKPINENRPETQDSAGRILSLDEAVRRHIEAALRMTRGRIEGPHGAARLLKINPHTLRARMRKLAIQWADYRTPGSEDSRPDGEAADELAPRDKPRSGDSM